MRFAAFAAYLVSALLLAACSSAAAREAAQRGEARAEADIAEGSPSLLFIGLVSPHHSPLDRETGLPQYSAGCVIDEQSTAFIGAYNDAIRKALREGRLAGMTFREKWTTRAELSRPFGEEGVARLPFRQALDAPGGRFRVEFAPRHHPLAPTNESPYLFVIDRASGSRRELRYAPIGAKEVQVLFADGGTTAWVSGGTNDEMLTFDLPHALLLQVFPAVAE